MRALNVLKMGELANNIRKDSHQALRPCCQNKTSGSRMGGYTTRNDNEIEISNFLLFPNVRSDFHQHQHYRAEI